MKEYQNCNLCQRSCGADRTVGVGYCKMPSDIYVSRAALHQWEEPIISGVRGSGTIFFSGCSLGCVFCQNKEISRTLCGTAVSVEELADIMLRLEHAGAHNVNFVTPTHYIPGVRDAILIARERGLSIPIVYNTGSYDSSSALKMLNGLVDIYLPDFKYYLPKTSERYSGAIDYPEAAKAAIVEMYRQVSQPRLGNDGMLKRGVIIRILLLPGHVAEAKLSLKYLHSVYGNNVYFSLMSQYTPQSDIEKPLDRRVTRDEYRQLTEYAERLGITRCFVQDIASAQECYIPPFAGIEV